MKPLLYVPKIFYLTVIENVKNLVGNFCFVSSLKKKCEVNRPTYYTCHNDPVHNEEDINAF